jgi:hypothetical protein
MRVEQHGGGLRLQLLDQHELEAGDVLVGGLGGAALLADRVLDRRALVDRHHLEAAAPVGHAAQAPELAGRQFHHSGPQTAARRTGERSFGPNLAQVFYLLQDSRRPSTRHPAEPEPG